MSERVEHLISEYPAMKRQLRVVELELQSFQGVTADEVIESMTFAQPEGERVQTSGNSEKTARIAMGYEERMDELNQGWLSHLKRQRAMLSEEIVFFESSISALSAPLSDIMGDMVLRGYTWDVICERHSIGRTSLWRYRRKAVIELESMYAAWDKQMTDYLLS